MVRLNRIYTRTGDDGTTGLLGRERRSKHDARIEAIGDVDETNATVGILRPDGIPRIEATLARVSNDLFDLGADLATTERDPTGGALRVTDHQVGWLEGEIDALNEGLDPLTSFVLPGGSREAAALHLDRTTCRRAERRVVTLSRMVGEDVNPAALAYLNRLSDYLFVASRHANRHLSRPDVL